MYIKKQTTLITQTNSQLQKIKILLINQFSIKKSIKSQSLAHLGDFDGPGVVDGLGLDLAEDPAAGLGHHLSGVGVDLGETVEVHFFGLALARGGVVLAHGHGLHGEAQLVTVADHLVALEGGL